MTHRSIRKAALIVRTADTELHLESLTEEAGYEGMPDGTPAISGDELYVFVRQDGWMLFAEKRGGDPVGCGPERREPEVTDLGNGWWKASNRSAAGSAAPIELRGDDIDRSLTRFAGHQG